MTLSGKMNNPAYLYSITYRDSMVGMNYWLPAEEPITVNDYSITFLEPQSYTLLQVKVDRFQGLALLGGLMTMRTCAPSTPSPWWTAWPWWTRESAWPAACA